MKGEVEISLNCPNTMLRLSLSVCAYDRILKGSRTIADLELRGDPIRSRGRSRWITLRAALMDVSKPKVKALMRLEKT